MKGVKATQKQLKKLQSRTSGYRRLVTETYLPQELAAVVNERLDAIDEHDKQIEALQKKLAKLQGQDTRLNNLAARVITLEGIVSALAKYFTDD